MEAIIIIILGLGFIISPKYFKIYRTYELSKKIENPNKIKKTISRFTGIILLIAGIVMFYMQITNK